MRFFLILTGVLVVLYGCSNHSHENQLFDQSVEAHELALKTSREVTDKIERMNALLEDLPEDQSHLKDSLSLLKQDFIDWEKSVIEVPGHESDIDGHEGHGHEGHNHEGHDHHDHSASPDLTMEMVLDIQQDLKDQIIQMNIRTKRLLENFEKEDQ